MLDGLATTVENFRPRFQASRHAVERVLMLQARNGAITGIRTAPAQRAIAAGRFVGIIDFRHFAQLAKAERRQFVTSRTSIGVPLWIVAKLVLAEEPFAYRRAALGPGNVRRQTGLLASLDVLGPEVARVRDDVDLVYFEDFAGRLGGRLQQPHVDDLVGHFLVDDQLVLGVDGDLDVVADSDLGVRRHGAAVGIGQRYLVFARALELPQHGVVSTAFLAQGLDFLSEILHPRAARRLFRRVALVKIGRA